jgi:hypothetical protein
VSGDRLAQIEASARSPYQRAHADIGMDDVLALVEVAKAAPGTGWHDSDGLCWCPESVEVTGEHIPRCQRMRDALARLDSLKSAAPTVTATPSKGGACPAGNDGNVGAAEGTETMSHRSGPATSLTC